MAALVPAAGERPGGLRRCPTRIGRHEGRTDTCDRQLRHHVFRCALQQQRHAVPWSDSGDDRSCRRGGDRVVEIAMREAEGLVGERDPVEVGGGELDGEVRRIGR